MIHYLSELEWEGTVLIEIRKFALLSTDERIVFLYLDNKINEWILNKLNIIPLYTSGSAYYNKKLVGCWFDRKTAIEILDSNTEFKDFISSSVILNKIEENDEENDEENEDKFPIITSILNLNNRLQSN